MNEKNPYLHVRHPAERCRTYTPVIGESMTHQSHAESCDVNRIIKRFENTGSLPENTREAQYADCVNLQGDLTERINMSREILDQAGRDLEAKRLADADQAEKQAALDAQELAKYREEAKSAGGDAGGEE